MLPSGSVVSIPARRLMVAQIGDTKSGIADPPYRQPTYSSWLSVIVIGKWSENPF
jgi:hypothetical protein